MKKKQPHKGEIKYWKQSIIIIYNNQLENYWIVNLTILINIIQGI